MPERYKFKFDWKSTAIILAVVISLYIVVHYFWSIFVEDGTTKFVNYFILSATIFLFSAHLLLFVSRKYLEPQKSVRAKKSKRLLAKIRNVVNYLTPLILVILLYYVWEKRWIFFTLLVGVLLLDRMNDLLRKNK